jgi:hypothetical protein
MWCWSSGESWSNLLVFITSFHSLFFNREEHEEHEGGETIIPRVCYRVRSALPVLNCLIEGRIPTGRDIGPDARHFPETVG